MKTGLLFLIIKLATDFSRANAKFRIGLFPRAKVRFFPMFILVLKILKESLLQGNVQKFQRA